MNSETASETDIEQKLKKVARRSDILSTWSLHGYLLYLCYTGRASISLVLLIFGAGLLAFTIEATILEIKNTKEN